MSSDTVKIFGTDSGDFVNGFVIWSALNALRPAKTHAPSQVDLADLALVRPYTAASIAAIGDLSDGGCSLVLPGTQSARDYICRCGILDFYPGHDEHRLPHSSVVVPVRRLTEPSPTFADEVTEAWEHEYGGMPAGLRPLLADHLDELIRNALSHAKSEIGCIVAAQVYPTRESIEIAVLDLGQTVRAHLRGTTGSAGVSQDSEAIIAATQEGVSGTPPGTLNSLGEPNSGIGLFELRSYCEAGNGEFTILSGEAIVNFGSEHDPMVQHFAGGFPGCLVYVKFFV